MPLFSISKLVTKSAISKPATRLYPIEKREPYAATRGRIEFVISDCIFCNLCAKKCPTDAIVCDRNNKSWQIDHLRCILCGNCVDACRKSCLTQVNVPAAPMTRKQAEYFQAETQTPEELEKERAAKGEKAPEKKDECCGEN